MSKSETCSSKGYKALTLKECEALGKQTSGFMGTDGNQAESGCVQWGASGQFEFITTADEKPCPGYRCACKRSALVNGTRTVLLMSGTLEALAPSPEKKQP